MKRFVVLFVIGACMVAVMAAHAAKETWKQQFKKVSDEYFDQVYFHYGPRGGTQAGYHQYDTQLEDLSRKNIDAEIAALKSFESRFEAIHGDTAALDQTTRGD